MCRLTVLPFLVNTGVNHSSRKNYRQIEKMARGLLHELRSVSPETVMWNLDWLILWMHTPIGLLSFVYGEVDGMRIAAKK
jgi:hypothetical protein